jgi:hypothetical protein
MYTLKTIERTKDLKSFEFVNRPFNIEKETKAECFDEFFKLNDRLKYCNGYGYILLEQEDIDDYKKWFSIENYVRCGGDMW